MKDSTNTNHPEFYGWKTLFGVMLVYGSLCGDMTYAYGVFLPAMGDAFHWSRSALSGPYASFILISGLLGPLAGMTVARFGARRNIVLCNVLVVLGLLCMSQVGEIWHVYFIFGVMGGVSLAFGEFIPITTIVNHWFIRKRSLAMGLVFASGGLGGFLMPPLISSLISDWGWRWAWVGLAVIHLFLAVILGGLVIRDRPEDLGQSPDGTGESPPEGMFHQTETGRVFHTPRDWRLEEAIRTPALWMIVALFSIILFVTNMLTTHQVAYLQDLQHSPLLSATALGLMLGMSIIGRLVCGVLGMRYEGRHLAVFFLGTMGTGVLALLLARGTFFIYLYAILTGIGFGGMIVLMPNMLGAYFGRTHYSRIVGWTTPAVTLLSAVSPTMAGLFYDRTGNYVLPFAIAAALAFLGIVIAWAAKPPN